MKQCLLLIVLLCVACNSNNYSTKKGNRYTLYSYFENGKVSTKEFYIGSATSGKKDSMYIVNFYNNGAKRDSINYKDNGITGWKFIYDIHGKLESQAYYTHNQLNGWSYNYDENGKLQTLQFYVGGKQFGDKFSYYSNGKIKYYNCYDFSEENRRVKVYDTLGNIVQNEGKILGQAQIYAKNYAFKINQNILIDIVVSMQGCCILNKFIIFM